MWALWLIVVGYVFSNAQGTFHAYYTALLGPAVAALVGIGTVALVALVRRDRRWWIAVGVAVAGTVVLQLVLSGRHPTSTAGPARVLVVGAVLAAARAGVRRCCAARPVGPSPSPAARCWRCCC